MAIKKSTTASKSTKVGKNVAYVVEGNILTITIDISKTFGPSSSGKTEIVATTSGSQEIGDTGIRLGLNAFSYPEK
jgi:hypothetical protein